MTKDYLENEMRIQRELLNKIIIDNDLNMSCEPVLNQSRVVDLIITQLMEFDVKQAQ